MRSVCGELGLANSVSGSKNYCLFGNRMDVRAHVYMYMCIYVYVLGEALSALKPHNLLTLMKTSPFRATRIT